MGTNKMKLMRKSDLAVLAIALICFMNVAAKKGKPTSDAAALKTTLAVITSDFQKLEKNLQQQKRGMTEWSSWVHSLQRPRDLLGNSR